MKKKVLTEITLTQGEVEDIILDSLKVYNNINHVSFNWGNPNIKIEKLVVSVESIQEEI